MYNYIKALHIIFIVTWFSGMFYIVRLFIYNAEAEIKPEPERTILHDQYRIMIRRLWLGITWPSAILTLGFGTWTWSLMGGFPGWLQVKLAIVAGLYLYHFSLQAIYRQQMKLIFRFSSRQLRIWNEVATLFLFAIVFIAAVKESMSWLRAVLGLLLLAMLLMIAIRVYRNLRSDKDKLNKASKED